MKAHLEARARYFGLFHRARSRELDRLERAFSSTMEAVRRHERSVEPRHREAFLSAIGETGDIELSYARNHGLMDVAGGYPCEGDGADPHLTLSQREASWADDDEESVGTMEDYRRAKGRD